MKIRTSLRKRNLLILAATVLMVVAGSYLTYRFFQERSADQEKSLRDTNSSSKKQYLNSDKESAIEGEGLPDDSAATTSDQVPTSSDTSIQIISTSQTDGTVKAGAQVSGTGEGTCVFMYEPADNGKPVSRQVDANDKKCSVSISQNEFAYLGEWRLTVIYYINGTKAEASQNVTIR